MLDLHNVARTVREFERAGAAGILLEDQVSPKRCGHFQGKQVISTEAMALKLKERPGPPKQKPRAPLRSDDVSDDRVCVRR